MSPLPVLSCCAPTRSRAQILANSKAASAERNRVTRGSTEEMIRLDATRFLMGSEDADSIGPDGEGPVRAVTLDSFYLDRYPVTNAQFFEFIRASGYRTEAEIFGWSFVFKGHVPDDSTSQAISGLDWWRRVDCADWAHPEGPASNVTNRDNHPVVHVSWNDAQAYANWAGKRLPTEAEWELAARGGLEQNRFPWGNELVPDGTHRCNIWQGEFPNLDLGEDGYTGPAPVDAYPENGLGFFTITGNVWEWCADWFSATHHLYGTRNNPLGPSQGMARSMRGGSYLCHASYCNRYRVSARTSNMPDSAATNIGFRCARDV